MVFKVINIDCNGKIIPDLSKVVLPPDLSLEIMNILLKGRGIEIADLQRYLADSPLDKEDDE